MSLEIIIKKTRGSDILEEADRLYLESLMIQREARRQEESEGIAPATLAMVTDEFLLLHHAATAAISDAGRALLDFHRYIIMATLMKRGGFVHYDRENLRYLDEIKQYIKDPKRINSFAWEYYAFAHIARVLPAIKKAMQLPSGEPAVGMLHDELREKARYLQAFYLAKTHGLELVRQYSPQLREGKIVVRV